MSLHQTFMKLGAVFALCGMALPDAFADSGSAFAGRWNTYIRTATSTCGDPDSASIGPLQISVMGDSVSVQPLNGGETLTGRLTGAHSFAAGSYRVSGDEVALLSLSLFERRGRANLKVILSFRSGDTYCGYNLNGTATKAR